MPVNVSQGVTLEGVTDFAKKLGFSGPALDSAVKMFTNMYKMAAAYDITQLEVNPLVETPDGRVACLDAKVNFDDSAEFRQKEIFEQKDESEMDWRDVEAAKHDLQ
eukprot:368222_1